MAGDRVSKTTPITCVFVDIGGVLLTNGWDHDARKRAADHFDLDGFEMEDRHRLNFATHEEGKLTLAEYLDRVVFYQERSFSREDFWVFMCGQSEPYPAMLDLVRELRIRHGLKIVAVSNEARELNAYRIKTFELGGLIDFFVSSCIVHLRKPDADIFRLALDLAQTPASQVVFIENTRLFVEVADRLGINGIFHTDHDTTRAKLAAFGLLNAVQVNHGTG